MCTFLRAAVCYSILDPNTEEYHNIVAAIKLARYMDYGPDDVLMTVATDSARQTSAATNSGDSGVPATRTLLPSYSKT